MPLPIYPGPTLLPGITYGSTWTPDFYNLPTATTASGADIDLAISQYPLHDFELIYEFLRDDITSTIWLDGQGLEFRTMMGFLLQIGGTAGRFLYDNPADDQVTQNVIGVGDGVTTAFTLTRTFGANGYGGTEPVGQVNLGETFNAYLNGSTTPLSSSLYTVSTANPVANTITFTTAPPAGQNIAVDMSYYYYCKLAQNNNTSKKFMSNLWSMDKVQIHSCRPGA
jgi:hypothetical protein